MCQHDRSTSCIYFLLTYPLAIGIPISNWNTHQQLEYPLAIGIPISNWHNHQHHLIGYQSVIPNQLLNCHSYVVTKWSFLTSYQIVITTQLPNCHYYIVTKLLFLLSYQIVFTKMSVNNCCYQNVSYQTVVTKMSVT